MGRRNNHIRKQNNLNFQKRVENGSPIIADGHEKFAVPTTHQKADLNTSELMLHYGHLIGQLQYEGSGIWSRFNIMIGLNISLFGLMALIYSTNLDNKDVLILIISIGGLMFSIWSLSVLKRLWLYHYHWKDTLQDLENLLPHSFIKPFSKIPAVLKNRKRNAFKVWFKSYTQPFFLILVLIWLSIIIVYSLSIQKKSVETTINKTAIKRNKNEAATDSLIKILVKDSLTIKNK